ncbi:HPF/RaiA family ribosome-associated protein [Azospirillum halopraeferens]|uniref:HPF/RaiA family ribosome-associated protein n=1 Tax=Azospirillum halopraeferens TaxID=34010 RepID=UPI0003FBA253|nr:HPF/RaiA family ribosome-associated protein [Azospirillum halopraeferens]
MDTNLEIAYHGIEPTPDVDAYIRERCEKLSRFYDRLVGVRVAVEAQHRQHQNGNVIDVRIELMVPGKDLVVSRQPKKAKERYANPDIRTSVRDAFEAAERQLVDFKQKQRGDVKPHDAEEPGRVSQIFPAEDHGFIVTGTGTQLYFHRNSCIDVDFDDLKTGEPVTYVETMGDTGPTASKVWRAAGPGNDPARL